MAKQRIVNTHFWDDSYIVALTPTEKLIFLYLLTNPLTNISGVYELPTLSRVALDTGLEEKAIEEIIMKLERDGKVLYRLGWIAIRNWIKHQTLNPKVKRGILLELERAPRELSDSLSIDYDRLSEGLPIAYDRLSDPNSNSNPNINTNPNGRPFLETVFGSVKRMVPIRNN